MKDQKSIQFFLMKCDTFTQSGANRSVGAGSYEER